MDLENCHSPSRKWWFLKMSTLSCKKITSSLDTRNPIVYNTTSNVHNSNVILSWFQISRGRHRLNSWKLKDEFVLLVHRILDLVFSILKWQVGFSGSSFQLNVWVLSSASLSSAKQISCKAGVYRISPCGVRCQRHVNEKKAGYIGQIKTCLYNHMVENQYLKTFHTYN